MSEQGVPKAAVEAAKARLAEERELIEGLERRLRGARAARELLVLKLGKAGMSERAIAPFAGVSNVTVHNILARPAEVVGAALATLSPSEDTGEPPPYDEKLECCCGHTARWHGQEIGAPEGSGGCEFNGDCECKRFLLRRPPEDTGPGSYGTDEPSEGSGAPLPEAECPACHKPITPTITDECPECGCFQYSEDPASRASAYPDARPLPEADKRAAISDETPVVRHGWPIGAPTSGIAPGRCIDSGFVLTDHQDCDVCLMVNQVGDFDEPRHALLRMTFFEAHELADALVAATWPSPQPLPEGEKCERCGGGGEIYYPGNRLFHPPKPPGHERCPVCHGTGKKPLPEAPGCGGGGVIKSPKGPFDSSAIECPGCEDCRPRRGEAGLRAKARALLDALDTAEQFAAGGEAQEANVNRVLTAAARDLKTALAAPEPESVDGEEARAKYPPAERLVESLRWAIGFIDRLDKFGPDSWDHPADEDGEADWSEWASAHDWLKDADLADAEGKKP